MLLLNNHLYCMLYIVKVKIIIIIIKSRKTNKNLSTPDLVKSVENPCFPQWEFGKIQLQLHPI